MKIENSSFYFLLFLVCSGCNSGYNEKNLQKEYDHVNFLADSIDKVKRKIIPEFDSLVKYSYELIPLFKGNQDGGGTAFFVRKNDNLFLISNFHVFTFYNTAGDSLDSNPCDTLLLRYAKYNKEGYFYDTINVKPIRDNNKPCYWWNCADVYSIKIKLPNDAIIYSVEDFIKPEFKKDENPDTCIYFGFITDRGEMRTGTVNGSLNKFLRIENRSTVKNHPIAKNTFVINTNGGSGFSGSPVFFKYNNSIVLGGIEFNHDPIANVSYAVRLKYILESLDK